MRWSKAKVVEVEQKRYESRAKCDGCGAKLARTPAYGTDGDADVVEISSKVGDVWDEGDFRKVEAVDCCPACWRTTVRPALEALGFKVYEYHASEDRAASMPEDPGF